MAASANERSRCSMVFDVNETVASRVAASAGATVASAWHDITASPEIDVVCIATPNKFLAPMAIDALQHGKHVLIEKPMGRGVAEAREMHDAARSANRLLKVGFNHRYHPGIAALASAVHGGSLGKVLNARCRYGHGARPGYDKEWRGNPDLAGGGELTDQGVHVLDLFHWLLGKPREAFCLTQRAFWPLNGLEDNGFALLTYGDGIVGSMHTSWTQWKNLFSLEVFGEQGSGIVEGLGRSYGVESLTFAMRKPEGGAPDVNVQAFEGPDESWTTEWSEFVAAILDGATYLGTPEDGVVVMESLAALYRSADSKAMAPVTPV